MKTNELTYPGEIGLLGFNAQVSLPANETDLIDQPRLLRLI